MSDPIPSFPDEETRQRVRALFTNAGFDDETLRRALGRSPHDPLSTVPLPVFREALRSLNPLLSTVFELFVAEETVGKDSLSEALCQHALADLRKSGLVVAGEEGFRGTVHLLPFGPLLLASDRRERHTQREDDMVPGPGGPTRTLADFSIKAGVESVLDLGCGPGGLGLLARREGRRVVATDINPRALALTRFNAGLNDLEGLDCREGSLFEPVAGERFDQILCNPPYAISPARTFLYRDGDEGMVQTILRKAPDHLTPRGCLQIMAEWPEPAQGDWRHWLEVWCREVEADVTVLRLYAHENAMHVWYWLGQEYGDTPIPQPVFREWMEFLEDAGIGGVGGGHLILRKPGNPEPRRVFRQAPARDKGPLGQALLRWLQARDLAGTLTDQELLNQPLLPAPGLRREDVREVSREGWRPGAIKLRLPSGLRFGAGVDPVAGAVVGLLDGERTPREATALLCRNLGADPEIFLSGLPGALRSLLKLGLLVGPAEERTES